MIFTEEASFFTCENDRLLGIFTIPSNPAETGIIVIVGGPQYRIGSHRQFVLLARRLALAGHAVLRFDCRGMGDSTGGRRSFEALESDIAAAVNAMQARIPALQNVILWGLCDGAAAALLYCHGSPNPLIGGLCLLNPWIRSEASLARTHVKHYYTQRVLKKEFWMKLLSGKVAQGALAGFIQKVCLSIAGNKGEAMGLPPFQDRMATAWLTFSGKILLLLSDDDYVAKEFIEYVGASAAWSTAMAHPQLIRHDIPGVDHTFSSANAREAAENLTLDWLATFRNLSSVRTIPE